MESPARSPEASAYSYVAFMIDHFAREENIRIFGPYDESDKARPFLVIATTVNLIYGWLLGAFMSNADSLMPWKFDFRLAQIDATLGVSASSVAVVLSGARCL